MNLKPIKQYRISHLIILVSFLTIFSCAKQGPLIIDSTVGEFAALDSARITSLLKEQEEKIHSVRGLALARLKSPKDKVSFKQVTIVENPDRLRLEALAPFGRTELAVISDGNKVLLKFPKDDVLYNQIKAFNFSVFYPNIPVPINIYQLSNFLLGRLPVDLYQDEYEIEVNEQDNELILSSTSSANTLWVDFRSLRITKASFLLEDDQKVVVHYDDFIPLEQAYFPKEIELNMTDYSIYIKYDSDVEINDNIRQSLFDIDS
ncbi:MAG: DUF4292 domain-containing protein [Candidatus Dadabacteria bacterium]|nr:DUF4292 domain-containing protein [Candidatus Dadabacteria bacterium]NIS08329.1 DUF4292 domain-containing protein [Candidatus Dadabacteria bacterium]NIV41753.1 DUF4292 domain-containing protein [Candidatus Dadabacteria bacterium]NIX15201.1 DUF4292 domain-containing protein [Candidatus Dadabacteria bacterium]NIY21846.1 DUF4292 domain-containing protein [Candidatus Dadabacteria bacterium]